MSNTPEVVLPSPDADALTDHNTDNSSSDSDCDRNQCPLLADQNLGIVQAVRMFGGVIIGAAAQEIVRTWQATSIPALAPEDEGYSGNEGDRADPVVASFRLSPPSPSQLNDENHEDSPEKVCGSDDLEINSNGRWETRRGSFLPQRSGGLKKRRIGNWRTSGERGNLLESSAGGESGNFVSECNLPTERGLFRLRAYRFESKRKTHEPVVMIAGDIRGRSSVPVRVHDQCQTSEVFGSKRCDCREQLEASLRHIQENGGGAVIYLPQEGRGIGLANKVAAYALQDGGMDTVDANRRLGFKDDERTYECVEPILRDMGLKSIKLMTNNPLKIEHLRATGVKVDGRIPIQVPANAHNHAYLEAKVARMGHLINNL